MKKYDEKIALKTDFVSKKNIQSEKIKTTNINILLNRVRLDRKKNLAKKNLIYISFNRSSKFDGYFFYRIN